MSDAVALVVARGMIAVDGRRLPDMIRGEVEVTAEETRVRVDTLLFEGRAPSLDVNVGDEVYEVGVVVGGRILRVMRSRVVSVGVGITYAEHLPAGVEPPADAARGMPYQIVRLVGQRTDWRSV